MPAFTLDRGSASAGGVLLASLSLGSLIGGVVYGARTWPGRLPPRLAGVMIGLGTGYALLALPSDYLPLALLLVLAGTLLAPASVICSTLLDTVAPPGTVTEAFAVMVTGIVAGVAVGNALGGSIVESASYDAAVLAAGGIAACGAVVVGRAAANAEGDHGDRGRHGQVDAGEREHHEHGGERDGGRDARAAGRAGACRRRWP